MTDDSKFVLRWEIDNATARCATGKVESEVFDKGGFEWTITAERIENDNTAFTLKCDAIHNQQWKCEADVGMKQYHGSGGPEDVWVKERACFNEYSSSWVHKPYWSWSASTGSSYLLNNKAIFELHVDIISSESNGLTADLDKFASPNEMSNVILKIGDEKLYVSTWYLSIHSPVFKTMFFGEFSEKGKEEVEIKDVDFKEFVDLLHVIYPGRFTISDATVIHVLGLGDRFQMERVIALAETHLCNSKKFEIAEKLRLADQFRLSNLRDSSLKSYKNSRDLGLLQSTPEYSSFSFEMKAAICDRLMSLVNAGK